MSKSEQHRQKKLAKKRAKEVAARRTDAQKRNSLASLQGQMKQASRYPIHACFIGDSIFSSLLGNIVLVRARSEGELLLMVLLIDYACLGVKHVFVQTVTPSKFDEIMADFRTQSEYYPAEPSRARKLTEGAIDFANSIGFPPHPDYRRIAAFWGDVDASQCDELFEFGIGGKPLYTPGPLDSPERQTQIVHRLAETVGNGNYFITAPSSEWDLGPSLESLDPYDFTGDSDSSNWDKMTPADDSDSSDSDSSDRETTRSADDRS